MMFLPIMCQLRGSCRLNITKLPRASIATYLTGGSTTTTSVYTVQQRPFLWQGASGEGTSCNHLRFVLHQPRRSPVPLNACFVCGETGHWKQWESGKSNFVLSQNKPSFKGSLRMHLNFWRENLETSSFILGVIEHG